MIFCGGISSPFLFIPSRFHIRFCGNPLTSRPPTPILYGTPSISSANLHSLIAKPPMAWSVSATGKRDYVEKHCKSQLLGYVGSEEQQNHLKGVFCAIKAVTAKAPDGSLLAVRGGGNVDLRGGVLSGYLSFTIDPPITPSTPRMSE